MKDTTEVFPQKLKHAVFLTMDTICQSGSQMCTVPEIKGIAQEHCERLFQDEGSIKRSLAQYRLNQVAAIAGLALVQEQLATILSSVNFNSQR